MPWSDGTAIVASSVQVGPVAGSTGSIVIEPDPLEPTGVIMNFSTGDAIESTPASIESSVVGGDQVLGLTLSSAGVVGSPGTNFPANINLFSQGTGGQGSQIQFGVSDHGDLNEFAVIIDGATQQIQLFGVSGSLGTIVADTWHNVALLNTWTNFGAPYNSVGYKYMPDGTVRLRGLAKSGTIANGTVMFNLPVGYRPTAQKFVGVAVDAGATNPRVTIATNGDVAIFGLSVATDVGFDSRTFEIT